MNFILGTGGQRAHEQEEEQVLLRLRQAKEVRRVRFGVGVRQGNFLLN